MRNPRLFGGLVLSLLVAFAPHVAFADLIWNSGTMDVYCYANTSVSDPPLKVLPDGDDHYFTSAYNLSDPVAGPASSSVSLSTAMGSDEMAFYGHVDRHPPGIGGGANADGQASFSFTVTQTRTYLVTNTATTPAGVFTRNSESMVQLTNSSGQILLQQAFFQVPPGPTNLTLTPGTYAVNWSIEGAPFGGQSTGMDWGWKLIPEPACPSLVVLHALLLRRSRRNVQ